MERICFEVDQVQQLVVAIEVSEDMVSNYFKISTSQWKHHRYDIKSLMDLSEDEITDLAYAQILRYTQHPDLRFRGSCRGEYFKICVQDHVILKTVNLNPSLSFLAFLTYIMTHELIHVVRFAKFFQHFIATEEERILEEETVHNITREIIKKSKISGAQEVVDFFSPNIPLESFQQEVL